jgi:drug/metabolite transporter (DMT)-like permease
VTRFTGIILVALSAAGFGTLALFGKYAFADGMDAITILFLRFSLAAVLMLTLLALRKEPIPRGGVLLQLIGMGAIGYMGQAFAYLSALRYASAGLVALLLYLYPIFIALISFFVLHEPITGIRRFALGLALAGTALTVGPAGGEITGIILGISAALIYSVYILVGARVMLHVSAVQSSAVIFTSAGITAGLLMGINGPHMPSSAGGWMTIISIVLIATVLPVATFLAGLKRIGASNAAMLSTLEPVVTVLLAAVCLGEILPPVTWAGGVLILSAVLLQTKGELRRIRPETSLSSKKAGINEQ